MCVGWGRGGNLLRGAGEQIVVLFGAVVVRSFRRYATYRVATAAGVFTNTVFGFLICFVYIALWSQRSQLGGYDVRDAITYAWVAQSLLMTVAIFGGGFQDEFAERVRRGDIAVDLYRPVNLQLWWLASDLGRAAYHLLARGIPPTLIGAAVFGLRLPTLAGWVFFLVSVTLAVVVSFAVRYLVALTAFWLVDSRGVDYLVGVCATFLSGMILPLVLFPGWLGDVARALPWAATVQVPIDVFLGKHDVVLTPLAFQAGWAVALLLAGQVVTAMAARKLVVQGG